MTIRWIAVALAISVSACGAVKKASECGNGMVEANEQCDEGAMNGNSASCCSQTCTLLDGSVTCRAAVTGGCDLAETCDGVNGACPNDRAMPDNTPCTGNGVSDCSAEDTCIRGACVDNDLPVGSSCGGNEATCNPATCDAAGACNNAAAPDNTACAENGGSVCCGASCSVTSTTGSCNACSAPGNGTLRIAIIESQSSTQPGQNQDDQWKLVATSLGHTATIQPQTFLDDITNLANIDVLIVSSHDIAVPQNRRDTILAFVNQGKGVYLQGEFDPLTFEGNKVWEAIVDTLGANFTWTGQVSGSLNATPVGCINATPNIVIGHTINFAATGTATGAGFGVIENGAPAGGPASPIAFKFCRQGGGLVLITTDKDDIRAQATTNGVPQFMKNMIFRLGNADKCFN